MFLHKSEFTAANFYKFLQVPEESNCDLYDWMELESKNPVSKNNVTDKNSQNTYIGTAWQLRIKC